MRRLILTSLVCLLCVPVSALAVGVPPGFRMEILVDGRLLCEYPARGTVYVEALKGHNYAIRLTNPLDVRVAVALSVDGLSTIDARRSSARNARKWVLDPHETITISGWQVDLQHARRFFFTTEEESYAQWLGKTENVGLITAVFFRERAPRIDPIVSAPIEFERLGQRAAAGVPPDAAQDAGRGQSVPGPVEKAGALAMARPDEYAATGIGDRTDHPVRRIYMDLEEAPAATLSIRYEYRPQLVRLGILPAQAPLSDPLARRERARGFDAGFCPEPPVRRRPDAR